MRINLPTLELTDNELVAIGLAEDGRLVKATRKTVVARYSAMIAGDLEELVVPINELTAKVLGDGS